MTRKMIINAVDPEEVRIAILRDRVLEDLDIETCGAEKNKGNIYKGIVIAVEPALNAAFVDYGTGKQGFLTANDVHAKYASGKASSDEGPEHDKHPLITNFLKPKQTVLVQVSKDEVGNKGAVLTTYLSLAGRYVVLMPDSPMQRVSRKIEDETTRRKIREAASKLEGVPNMGVIIRTAGKDRTKADLNRDLKILLRLWENIQKEANHAKAPALIFKEQDVIIRALRDYFSTDIDEIVLDSDEAYDQAAEYMHLVMPNHRSVLTRYVERRPIFHHYRIEEQLEMIYAPKVFLPSGGSIVIESTEALVAIDVNSGKQKSANQEETALQNNMEAAYEIARQLRLRNLSGIIVCDFIDMQLRKHQQRVKRALKEALRMDKARVKVGSISSNGTLEITRQRIRSALQTSVFDRCSICHGTGHVLGPASHAIAIIRELRDRASRKDLSRATIRVGPDVASRLRTENRQTLQNIKRCYGMELEIIDAPTFQAGQHDFNFETNPQATAVPYEEPNFGPAPRPEDYMEPSGYQDHDALEADIPPDGIEDGFDAQEDVVFNPQSWIPSSLENGMATPLSTKTRRRRRRSPYKARLEPLSTPHTLEEEPPTACAESEMFAMPDYEWVELSKLRLGRSKARREASLRGPRRTKAASAMPLSPTSSDPEPVRKGPPPSPAPPPSRPTSLIGKLLRWSGWVKG